MTMGKDQTGADVDIDLPRLLETRMLVQANSGGVAIANDILFPGGLHG